jgi:hypothetical protein
MPFLYIFIRWKPIIEMQSGYRRLTELLTLILCIDLLTLGCLFYLQLRESAGGAYIPPGLGLLYKSSPTGHVPGVIIVLYPLLGSFLVGLAHYMSRRYNEPLTLSFNAAIFTYLAMLGTGFFFFAMWLDSFLQTQGKSMGIGTLLIG